MVTAETSKKLENVTVMVVDPDVRLAEVIRRVLQSFGFLKISIIGSGSRALEILESKKIDLLICEWEAQQMTGLDLIERVRQGQTTAPRDLPIVMLTGQSEQQHVESARDGGVTEYLVKPFTAKTLSNRLVQVIDNPRMFIQTKEFTGPDRRRRRPEGSSAADRKDNRTLSTEDMLKHSEQMPDGRMRYNKDGVKIYFSAPNLKIKEELGGADAKDIFSPKAIEAAQEKLLEAKDDFIQWVVADLEKLEQAYRKLEKDDSNSTIHSEIQKIAFSIMSRSGSFEFPLGSQVSRLLHDYVRDAGRVHLIVVRKHIDTLYVIFLKRMEGDVGEEYTEIVTMLKSLIRKLS